MRTSTASQLATKLDVSNVTFYFSYGSNMWLSQMAQRCPNSKYLGIARIPYYRWIINARGSANIISSVDEKDAVWGLVYYLAPSDEACLDVREHVPSNFTKEVLATEFRLSEDSGKAPFERATETKIHVEKEPERVDMLVYINRVRITEDRPRDEYIGRMNEGIRDALSVGVPEEYVEKVLRRFIPEEV